MNSINDCSNNTNGPDSVEGENQLLESLRDLWIPHQRQDLRIRYQMGKLLNHQLGSPTKRQSYGIGIINRISKELDLDKSDISRMRRFAAMSSTFEAFEKEHPKSTSWTKVRQLIVDEKPSPNLADSRVLWGLLRSANSMVEALSNDHEYIGPKADELRTALKELCQLAFAKLGIRIEELDTQDEQTDS